MSNFLEHLNNRKLRYDKFVESSHFKQTLRGLHHIELNLVENCTRKCSFCPRSNSTTYPNLKTYASLDLIKIFAERCIESSYKEEIHITGFGEPLLHPNLYEAIRLLRIHGLTNFINITTNGDLLDIHSTKKLFESGVTHITVSCYEENKYGHFASLFQDQSIDRFFIRQLWNKENPGFADRLNLKSIHLNSQCYIPFYKMFIDYNGTVLLCSNDWYRTEQLGLNINTQTLEEIWNSVSLTAIRNNLYNKQRTNSACSKCNVQGTIMGKESAVLLYGASSRD